MKRAAKPAAREATGCFLILVLAAIMCVGVMRIVVLAIGQSPRLDQSEWWQSILMWLIAPAAGCVLVAWLTYGIDGLRSRIK